MSKEPNAAARKALDELQRLTGEAAEKLRRVTRHFEAASVHAYDGNLGGVDLERGLALRELSSVGRTIDDQATLLLSVRMLDRELFDEAAVENERAILKTMDLEQVRALGRLHVKVCQDREECAMHKLIGERLRELKR